MPFSSPKTTTAIFLAAAVALAGFCVWRISTR
jgi:hypothetical protein